MSTYRKSPKKQIRHVSHSRSRDRYLLDGSMCPGWGFDRENGTEDTTAAQAYWESHRERLLLQWCKARPGTRPYWWWRTEAPGRRETRNGRIHPFDDKQRTLHVASSDSEVLWRKAYQLHWGLPSCMIPPFDTDLIHDFHKRFMPNHESDIFEEEWYFLSRHNLLREEDSP
jgi:hypothetical protein